MGKRDMLLTYINAATITVHIVRKTKMTNRIFHTKEWKRVTGVLKMMMVNFSKT
jgi:hypothetical protein